MLVTSPYEATLLAEERTRDGIRRARQLRHFKAMRQGSDGTIANLAKRILPALTASIDHVRSTKLLAARKLQ
jgi:hypothetical protein